MYILRDGKRIGLIDAEHPQGQTADPQLRKLLLNYLRDGVPVRGPMVVGEKYGTVVSLALPHTTKWWLALGDALMLAGYELEPIGTEAGGAA